MASAVRFAGSPNGAQGMRAVVHVYTADTTRKVILAGCTGISGIRLPGGPSRGSMTYDEAMGARPMARIIQQKIKTPLADEVLFGRLKNGGTVRVCF